MHLYVNIILIDIYIYIYIYICYDLYSVECSSLHACSWSYTRCRLLMEKVRVKKSLHCTYWYMLSVCWCFIICRVLFRSQNSTSTWATCCISLCHTVVVHWATHSCRLSLPPGGAPSLRCHLNKMKILINNNYYKHRVRINCIELVSTFCCDHVLVYELIYYSKDLIGHVSLALKNEVSPWWRKANFRQVKR